MAIFSNDPFESLLSPNPHTLVCPHEGGSHRICCWEWPAVPPGTTAPNGQATLEKQTVFCVHGLTRTGRDFDVIASRLARRGHRVIAPDMAGRGASDWLDDSSLYALPQYIADVMNIVATLKLANLAWIGTSMGGLIGMGIASMAEHPIERLLLNDIGAEVSAAGLQRIADSLNVNKDFASFEEGERVLRESMSNFGSHTDDGFRVLSRHYLVERGGRWTYHYDPRIADPFEAALTGEPLSIWPAFGALKVPITLLRGELSDVLSESTAERMRHEGRDVRVITVGGVGHAPTLIEESQCRLIEDFLR